MMCDIYWGQQKCSKNFDGEARNEEDGMLKMKLIVER